MVETQLLSAAQGGTGVELFALGYWLPGLSVGIGVLGMLVGLACAVNGRRSSRFRPIWVAAAASAIGGVGLWLSTAVSLLGISVPGSALRCEPTVLIVSLIVTIVSVFAGLLVAGRDFQLPRMLGGGSLIGLGFGVMLCLDLLALDIRGTIELTIWLPIGACVVSVLAAMLCLWLFQQFRFASARIGTTALFALSIAAIYYIGVAGLEVVVDRTAPVPEGQELFGFVFPMFVIGLLALAAPITAVLIAPDRREFAATTARDNKGSDTQGPGHPGTTGDTGTTHRANETATTGPVPNPGGQSLPEPAR